MSKTVLITGARAPVAIDISRAFMAAGYAPILADSVIAWAAKASKCRAGPVLRHPRPRYAFEKFAAWLKDFVQERRPAIIVPTCEEVFYVSAAAQLGGFSDLVFAPDLDTLNRLHSKILMPSLLDSIGIAGPKTWRIHNRSDLDQLSKPVSEYVFKPEYSRFATATLIKPSPEAVAALPFGTGQDWAAQSFIEGDEICFWSAARQGDIVAHAAYRPLWRHGRSAAYAFEHLVSQPALDTAAAIAKATQFTGHLSFDMILTSQGQAIPIECNPRAVSGVHLLDAQPALAHNIMGGDIAHMEIAPRRHLCLAMIGLGLPSAAISGKLPEFLSDWRSSSDVLGRPGDKGPIAGTLLDAARFAFTGLRHLKSAAAETTDDIEWNGQPLL